MSNATNKTVMVAVSGGIDSTAAVMLLQQQGYNCRGVYMLTSEQSRHPAEHVKEVADKLNIELDILDLRKDFQQVINYFCTEYKNGRTPNPCVYCNRHIKFGKLLQYAESKGADFFATGHYAKIISKNNYPGLYQSSNTAKDQSYALAMIDKEFLKKIIFPLGDYEKSQAREIVSRLGMNLENRDESQEICFIPDDDYIGFLEKHIPRLAETGDIIDSDGNVLAQHSGTHRYTIGQRRGLGVAMGVPYYVTAIDPEQNNITLGPKDEVMHKKLTATNVNWLVPSPGEKFRAQVKIRYNSRPQPAVVEPRDSEKISIEFDQKAKAVTPGQLAVAYSDTPEGKRVLCGGWIKSVDS
jgi:tRNA-specific 2-thiouridylase